MNFSALSRAATEARGLAMDAVQASQSGHLGLPLGCAEIGAVLEASVAGPGAPAPVRLRSLVATLSALSASPSNRAMAEFLHRRENQALHDRLTELLAERLFVLVESIVAQGAAEGSMVVTGAGSAAWFVLGGLQSVERAGTPIADMPAALDEALALTLRALGVEGAP